MKIKSIAIAFFILISSPLLAQKIKYKDLFPILESKNYAEGGPMLSSFLSDPKNAEEANAHLQMGFMLENQLMAFDPIADSVAFFSKGDSAVSFFTIAKNLITEKELKKNDKYYQTFFRRDLRTGDFGIKISDVHLDIEKKIEGVEKKIAEVKTLNKRLLSLSKNYKKSALIYKSFVDQFLRYNAFLIGADDDTNSKLSEMVTSSEKAQADAKSIIEITKTLGSASFPDQVTLKPIDQFGKDGLIISEIENGTLELWDYAGWAQGSQSEIRGSIGLFKSLVLNYAYEIREKKDKVKKGTDVEVAMLNDELVSQFQKYDPESTVEKLLRIETYETQIIKQLDISINKALQDSSLIGAQLQIFEKAKVLADEMSVLVSSITQDDLDGVKKLYKNYSDSFFQKYGTASKYVSDMNIWSSRQVEWLGNAIEFWSEKNSWGVSGENMIPLYAEDAPETNFFTLGVPVKKIDEVIVWGANMKDKKGYLIGFGPDRFEKWKLDYKLPNSDVIQFVSDTISTSIGSAGFYVFNEAAEKNNLAVINYSLAGELNWNTVLTVSKKPVAYKFNSTTQELTIFLYPQEELPLDSNELGYKVIDRTGAVR
jgi:hypothetical protein